MSVLSDLAHVLAYDGRFVIKGDGEEAEIEATAYIEWDESAWLNIKVTETGTLHLSAGELRGIADAIDLVIDAQNLARFED